jgi:hypothetical protein
MAAGIIGTILGGALTGGVGPAIGAALPTIADTAKVLVDRLVPDPNAKAAAQAEVEKALAAREIALVTAATEVAKGQASINLAEAQGNDRFSARWRPAVGWICATGFGYQFVAAPVLTWVTNLVNAIVGCAIPVAPSLSINDLMVVLTGILGLGVLRTTERVKDVPGAAAAQASQLAR